jgi:hypothetical protein
MVVTKVQLPSTLMTHRTNPGCDPNHPKMSTITIQSGALRCFYHEAETVNSARAPIRAINAFPARIVARKAARFRTHDPRATTQKIPRAPRSLTQIMVHAVAFASASTSLDVVVSPKIIEALDNSIRDQLQTTSHEFFFCVLISAFVVAVGVVMEGPEILHELWPSLFRWFTWTSNERLHRFERRIKKIAFVGWFLIGIGVFGEGVFEGLQNRAEGQLQTFNGILLKDARLTAATAKDSAESAALAARNAQDSAEAVGKEADVAEYVLSARRVRDEDGLKKDFEQKFKSKSIVFKSYAATTDGQESFWLCEQLEGIARKAGVNSQDKCATEQLPRLPSNDLLISAPTHDEAFRLGWILKGPGRVPGYSVGENEGPQLTVLIGIKESLPLWPDVEKEAFNKNKSKP